LLPDACEAAKPAKALICQTYPVAMSLASLPGHIASNTQKEGKFSFLKRLPPLKRGDGFCFFEAVS